MKMGHAQPEGVLFGRMHSYKRNRGLEDIPARVRDYTEKHAPEYLEPADDWDDGFPIGTWEAYARQVEPED